MREPMSQMGTKGRRKALASEIGYLGIAFGNDGKGRVG